MTDRTAPEQRTIDVDVTDVDTRGRTLHGYAAVYGAVSGDLGGFRETISPGAFRDVIGADVRCLLNHDPSQVLGRTRSGTLRLADEQRGLRFECDLPDSPLGENVRAAVKRGDIDGASFRFVVGEETWEGDLRTVESVSELRDVTVATYGADPDASVELRTRPESNGGERRQEEGNMPENEGAAVEERTENEDSGEERADDRTEERTEDRAEQGGTLRVEDRADSTRAGTLTEAFRRAGWPEERAEISFGEFRSLALATGTTATELAPSQQVGAALGADERYAYPAFPQVGVDSGVTSVNVVRQTTRTLAASGDVVRDIAETTEKPETSSEIEIVPTALHQIASKQSGIPNVYLETNAVATIIENDLRLAVNEGLDKLVLDALATADNEDPTGTTTLAAIRAAMTTIQGAGYNPDTLVLDPATSQALDTLVADTGTEFYVFGPGQEAGSIFGLRKRVSKGAPAPVVCDSSATGRLFTSPVRLARFEENDGATNTSLIRLELHALFGTERIAAAVRIAAA